MPDGVITQIILRAILGFVLGNVGEHWVRTHRPPPKLASVFWSQSASDPLHAKILILPAYQELPR